MILTIQLTGACWYLLATQRFASCLNQQCDPSRNCNLSLYCSLDSRDKSLLPAAGNLTTVTSKCLDVDGPFEYGIYKPVVFVYSSNKMAGKILYPIFWGLLCLRYICVYINSIHKSIFHLHFILILFIYLFIYSINCFD